MLAGIEETAANLHRLAVGQRPVIVRLPPPSVEPTSTSSTPALVRSAVSVAAPVPVILHTPGPVDRHGAHRNPRRGRGEGGVALGGGGVVGVAAGIVGERAVAIRPIGGDRPIGGGVVPRAGKVRRVGGGCESAEGRNGNRERQEGRELNSQAPRRCDREVKEGTPKEVTDLVPFARYSGANGTGPIYRTLAYRWHESSSALSRAIYESSVP